MNGFTAYKLTGKCNTEVTSGDPFSYMQAHVSWGTPTAATVFTGQTGLCGNSWSKSPTFAGNRAYRYGPTTSTGSTDTVVNTPSDVYVKTAELSQFTDSKQLLYPPNPFYTITLSGPRYKSSHVTIPLRRIKYGNTLLNDYDAVYWTDWAPDTAQPDIGTDWLGMLLPGTYCMAPTDYAANPFKAERYWENSGSGLNLTSLAAKNLMYSPWCTPLNVYNSAGTKIGAYVGTGFLVFLSPACVKDPRKPVNDPRSLLDPPPKLSTEYQYWSIEMWTYLIGSGISSPRISTQRWWYFSQSGPEPSATTRSPHTPYWFLRCKMMSFSVRFNVVGGTTKDIYFPFSNGELAIVA